MFWESEPTANLILRFSNRQSRQLSLPSSQSISFQFMNSTKHLFTPLGRAARRNYGGEGEFRRSPQTPQSWLERRIVKIFCRDDFI